MRNQKQFPRNHLPPCLRERFGLRSTPRRPRPIRPQKPPTSRRPLEIALDGTIGGVLAILRGPDGSEALGEIGDDVNGAVIVAIRPSEVDLRDPSGSIITIRRPAESGDLTIPTPRP